MGERKAATTARLDYSDEGHFYPSTLNQGVVGHLRKRSAARFNVRADKVKRGLVYALGELLLTLVKLVIADHIHV